MRLLTKARTSLQRTVSNEDGLLGYGIAWLLGVPLSILVIIYLIFGR